MPPPASPKAWIYVSPKTGRAVSEEAGAPYADRLLKLPSFLVAGGAAAPEDVLLGLELTGYFIERHVFWPHNGPLPPARDRFLDTLRRQAPAQG